MVITIAKTAKQKALAKVGAFCLLTKSVINGILLTGGRSVPMRMNDTDWRGIVVGVNVLMRVLKNKPTYLKIGYLLHPSGILNAYREGDLTFNQAVKELERWKKG